MRYMYWMRRHCAGTVFIAVFCLLFAQLAVAAHSCQGPAQGVQAQQVVAIAQAGMPCAEAMAMAVDDGQPGLCHAHCHGGSQAADKFAVDVPVAAPSSGVSYAVGVLPVRDLRILPQAPLLARAAAPPLAIRNCCFRI